MEIVQKHVQTQIPKKRIRGQLSHPSNTKAPEKNKKYNEDLRACVSRNRQKTPRIAAVDPTPTTAVEEDSMATPNLEEPHRMEALRKPKTTTGVEARIITSHRPRPRPELLRPWIDAHRRLTPREYRAQSTLQPTAPPATPDVPLMKRAADTATFKATKLKAARTPVHEPAKLDSTCTRSSPTPEKSAAEARKSTGGPYSKQTPPPPSPPW
jgi:hypothetical protein